MKILCQSSGRAGAFGVFATVAFAAASLAELPLLRVVDLKGRTYHVQGIDTDGERLWVTSVDIERKAGVLSEFDIGSGNLIRSTEVQDGPRYHASGLMATSDALWLAVAEYRPASSAVVQRRNKRTLAVEAQFRVDDHIGCIAVTEDTVVGANWDARQFYLWDRAGREVRRTGNQTGNAYQDLKFVGEMLVSSGLLRDGSGAVDWLEWPSLRLARRMTTGKTDRGVVYTREGMTIREGRLLFLPEDFPSRLFVFRLDRE